MIVGGEDHELTAGARARHGSGPRRFLLIVAIGALPFLIQTIGWELALQMPGRFRVDDWHTLVSISSIAAGIAIVVLTARSLLPLAGKIVLSAGALLVYAVFALLMQFRSSCGDEPVFIGEHLVPKHKQVASCG